MRFPTLALAAFALAVSGCAGEGRPDGGSPTHADAARPHPAFTPPTEQTEIVLPLDGAPAPSGSATTPPSTPTAPDASATGIDDPVTQ